MPLRRDFLVWLMVAAPLLLTLLLLWLAFPTGEALAWFFRHHRNAHPDLRQWLRLLTDWGLYVSYLAYAVIAWRSWRMGDRAGLRFVLVFVIVQVLSSFLLVRLVKVAVGRPRPWVEGVWGGQMAYVPWSLDNGHHAMPSGHTAEAAGAATPLALAGQRLWLAGALGLYVALVAFSRAYLGEHHPADLFFGFCLGTLGGVAVRAWTSWTCPWGKRHAT